MIIESVYQGKYAKHILMKNIQTFNFKFKETGQESFRVNSRRPGGCTCRLQRPDGCTCRLQTTYFQTLFRLRQSPLLSEAIVSTTFPTLQTFGWFIKGTNKKNSEKKHESCISTT